ncbi:MAG TPA: DUF2127 domain-containing protein [Tepidisphaeraceae bacterium]|nr:DUF2127 domain-containing protein [Tepidisphaeraceae bacterium]
METPTAQVLPHSPHPKSHRSRKLLVAIGLLKLVHASLMAIVAAGAIFLTKTSVVSAMKEWAEDLDVGPRWRTIGDFVSRKVLGADHHLLRGVAIGAGFYACLFATEGIGLLLDKLWAEWLAVVATASLIPLELMETLHRRGWLMAVGLGAIAVNVAIVIYLARQVKIRISESKLARLQGL